MHTTICFLNDKIIAMSGKARGRSSFVKSFEIFELAEGSVINGVITDSGRVREVLRAIKNEKNLYYKNNVTLIIDSSLIYVKHASFSPTSKAKMQILAENEFVGIDSQSKDMIFDYSVIKCSKQKKPASITCYAVEKTIVTGFLEVLDEEKIKPVCIDISYNCIEKFISGVSELNNKTFLIATVEKNNMLVMLFVNGVFYYSTRARLLNDYGTEEYYQEIATNISSINQFNKSQRNGHEIKSVFLCGMSEIDSMHCTQYIKDIGLENSSTIPFKSVFDYSSDIHSVNSTELLFNAGSLIRK